MNDNQTLNNIYFLLGAIIDSVNDLKNSIDQEEE